VSDVLRRAIEMSHVSSIDAINALALIGMRSQRAMSWPKSRPVDPGAAIRIDRHELRKGVLARYRREILRIAGPFPVDQECIDAARDVELRIWNDRILEVEGFMIRKVARAHRPRLPTLWEMIVAWWRRKTT
jgi:hypothetical protein